MKKALNIIYKMLCDTTMLFCVTVLLMALFLLNTTTANLTREVILSIFGFSAIFGLSAIFGFIESLPSSFCSILRFILTAVGFVVFVLLSFERTSAQIFVATAFFTVVYWIAFTLIKLILLPLKKKEEGVEKETEAE
ncbi:MAG: hypothetical protein IKV53_05455 [Clostridia bacterium]|nr:hypothetical protein [Clostridia bacterium]